jgi:hypothetical protein
MASPVRGPLACSKTCNRCGRIGSHAFRRIADGLFECTTATACYARSRRNSGQRQDGRGRLPRRQAPWDGGGLGIAYLIGPHSEVRDSVERTLRQATDLALVVGPADRLTLAALGSRNVKLIALDGRCLGSVGFRNELSLRRRQPRLGSVPILVYGDKPGAALPGAHHLVADSTRRAVDRLRNQILAYEGHTLEVG